MEIHPYSANDHKSFIQKWLEARQLDVKLLDELPEFGFVALEAKVPVAAGFIRRTESSSIALFDSLITDPTQEAWIRHQAVDNVVIAVIEKAKELKISQLLAFSIDKNTLLRSERHGFVKFPHSFIGLDLGSLPISGE